MRCARLVSVLTAGALVAVMSACGSSPGSGEGSAEKPDPAKPVVVLAAGDIACDPDSSNFRDGQGTPTACAQMATSDIAMAINPDALLALGDIQYGDGRLDDYEKSFVKSWGRLRSVLHPVPGNQEYRDDAAAAVYFAHFGQLAGVSGQGYYSFALGSWQIIALNSNIDRADSSEQDEWLEDVLANTKQRCILAYWHHARFSSAGHGANRSMRHLWRTLETYGADVALVGHDHDYERFAPQTSEGVAKPSGIRQFVVGTGGNSHGGLVKRQPYSEAFDNKTFGLLRLDLAADSYRWKFLPVKGSSFTDAGTGRCHR